MFRFQTETTGNYQSESKNWFFLILRLVPLGVARPPLTPGVSGYLPAYIWSDGYHDERS